MADWHIGQKIVCITRLGCPSSKAQLAVGEIYTIRGIYIAKVPPNPVCFWLEEIIGPYSHQWGHERGFRALHFRPVRHVTNDISIFHEILNKINANTPTFV